MSLIAMQTAWKDCLFRASKLHGSIDNYVYHGEDVDEHFKSTYAIGDFYKEAGDPKRFEDLSFRTNVFPDFLSGYKPDFPLAGLYWKRSCEKKNASVTMLRSCMTDFLQSCLNQTSTDRTKYCLRFLSYHLL